MTIDIADLRAKLAASETNPGRWHWAGNTDVQRLYLATWVSGAGRCTVMDFARWGMQSAKPQFTEDLMLVDGEKRVIYEVAPHATDRRAPEVYRADIVGIRHPDAELIVAAVNALPALLDEVERLRVYDAQVRAEALRDAARKFAEGEWADAFLAADVQDDVSAVKATDAWFNQEADRIARQAGGAS